MQKKQEKVMLLKQVGADNTDKFYKSIATNNGHICFEEEYKG